MTVSQHLARKATRITKLEKIQQAAEAALLAFQPTGNTGDFDIPTTRQVPDRDELVVRQADGLTEIVRVLPTEKVIVSATNHKDGQELAIDWLAGYDATNMKERAERYLGIDDPMEKIRQQAETLRINGQGATESGYTRKVTMDEVKGAEGVLLGGTDKVKRVTWRGHGGFALARAMGHLGLTGGQAVKVFEAIKMPLGKAAIIGGVYSGKKGERGAPAPLTADDRAILDPIIKKVQEEPVKGKAPEVKAKEKANKAEVMAISTARVPVQKLTGTAKKKAHGEAVMKEVARRKAAKK